MGLRFRRSVTLIPGVRLNLSMSGLGVSIGPRGASFSAGPSGRALNFGLPGTGISYRTPLGSAATAGVLTARQRDQLERQARREAEREAAAAAHDEHQRTIYRLQQVLADRDTRPLDWAKEFAPLPPFEEAPFRPPLAAPTLQGTADDVNTANPLRGWAAGLIACSAAVLIAPSGWTRLGLVLPIGYFAARLIDLIRRRPQAASDLLREREAAYQQVVIEAHKTHDDEQKVASAAHEAEQSLRSRLMGLTVSNDLDLAMALLESELSNEDFPIPVEFDLEADTLRFFRIRLSVPNLDCVPDTKTSLTSTGRLSTRKMAARDRRALYQDLCAGVALRLAYETFRVLPFVEQVVVVGVKARNTGRPGDSDEVLQVELKRSQLWGFDLDAADPSELFAQLGGTMVVDRYGDLVPLPRAR
ncbi:MAG: DUF4236 domain-containing protein [Gemmatimonadales bacterium]|nr:DUF4236 domain-containing protein [Gemmatimonadales bacterium]